MNYGDKMLTVQEFQIRFGNEERCGEQLTRQRWPNGFVCPRCSGPSRGYMASRRVHECARCGYQCSVTAGTIFHQSHVPLTGWFWAIYRLSQNKKGVAAMQLSREIGVGYRAAWLLLHKLRKAMKDATAATASAALSRPTKAMLEASRRDLEEGAVAQKTSRLLRLPLKGARRNLPAEHPFRAMRP